MLGEVNAIEKKKSGYEVVMLIVVLSKLSPLVLVLKSIYKAKAKSKSIWKIEEKVCS